MLICDRICSIFESSSFFRVGLKQDEDITSDAPASKPLKRKKEAISNSVEEDKIEKKKYSKRELNDMIHRLEVEMKEAASRLDFERATELRDVIFELKDLK